MKRIALLIATNLAVVLLLSAVVQIFGIDNYLAQRGLNYESLLIFSAVILVLINVAGPRMLAAQRD